MKTEASGRKAARVLCGYNSQDEIKQYVGKDNEFRPDLIDEPPYVIFLPDKPLTCS